MALEPANPFGRPIGHAQGAGHRPGVCRHPPTLLGDALLQRNSLRRGSWGCELGSLAAELSDTDENARVALAEHFRD